MDLKKQLFLHTAKSQVRDGMILSCKYRNFQSNSCMDFSITNVCILIYIGIHPHCIKYPQINHL